MGPLSSSSSMSAEEKKRQDEYRAKDDARTLTEAEEVHGDHKRLAGAHRHLKNSAAALHRTLGRISGKGNKRKSSRK